jgi:hypothetical protein
MDQNSWRDKKIRRSQQSWRDNRMRRPPIAAEAKVADELGNLPKASQARNRPMPFAIDSSIIGPVTP